MIESPRLNDAVGSHTLLTYIVLYMMKGMHVAFLIGTALCT